MNRTLILNRTLTPFAAAFVMLTGLVFLIRSPQFGLNADTMSLAVTIDLLLTTPAVYFLLVRRTNTPNTTVVPVMLVGLLIGYLCLPDEHHRYLNLFKIWALPVIELAVITFVIMKVRSIRKRFATTKESGDFFTQLKSACSEIVPRPVVWPVATEVAVFYYGFLKWKAPATKDNEFSIHRNSGTPALMMALIFVIAIETFVLHLIVHKYSSVAAWILSALSVYTALQVFGFAKSISQRPLVLDDDQLRLRFGIMNETVVPLTDIQSIEQSRAPIKQFTDARTLCPLGELESHNVLLHLKRPNVLAGLYGIRKPFTVLALYVDEASSFVEAVRGSINATSSPTHPGIDKTA